MASMRTPKSLLLPLLPLLLSGCVEFHIVGHTDDWSDVIIGTGSADPVAGRGTATITLDKLGISCSGGFKDYAPGRARGEVVCNDGRRIAIESWLVSMTRGKGTGRDNLGHSGVFDFMTDRQAYEDELARVRAEVGRRNLGVDHLKVAHDNAVARLAAPTATTQVLPAAPAVQPVAPRPAPPVPAVAADPGKKLALVIGNAAYREAPLKNPVNDARALAAKLQSLGFEVMIGENLGLRDMTRLVTRFGEKLAGKGVGLFFYAGHGMQVKGRNYLLPVDAQIGSEASARSESIDLDQVLDHLSASGTPFNLVMLDACRNNPFERRFRSTGGGLAQVDAPKGTLIAFATAPGKVAMDGDGANSTYTTALLKALDEPGLPVESVFKRVRGEVARVTGDQQVPWESSSLTGDFFFVPAAARAAAAATTSEAELLFWQSIKDSADAEELGAYLRKYPDGQFADIARNRLKKLGGGR